MIVFGRRLQQKMSMTRIFIIRAVAAGSVRLAAGQTFASVVDMLLIIYDQNKLNNPNYI